MKAIDELLAQTAHRPFDHPRGDWAYYQEWNDALFLHWKVDHALLRPLVPVGLHLDIFEGSVYVSLVAFTMQKIRPVNLPAVKFISDFDEINLRTYIDNDDRKGVYFLNIEAGKRLSAFVARALSGLPYEKSAIVRTRESYQSTHAKKSFHLDAGFQIEERIAVKTELDRWLTERYCLCLDKGEKLYRYDIHHKEWELKKLALKHLDINYKIGALHLTAQPDFIHYSDGVRVIAWSKSML